MVDRPVDYGVLGAVRENVKRWIKAEQELLDGLLD